MSDAAKEAPEWKIMYWPGMKGRGEYPRLVLVEAGVDWEDVTDRDTIVNFCWQGGNKGFPVRCPPVLLGPGGLVLCDTVASVCYLGRRFGLMPPGATPEVEAQVQVVLEVLKDGLADGRLAFHPKDHYASHRGQVAESQPYIRQYGEERLPKYMQYIESVLQYNGSRDYLFGDALCVADLYAYHFLAAAQQHYTQWYEREDAPRAKALQARVAARPRIAAYLASPRCAPWDTDSMM